MGPTSLAGALREPPVRPGLPKWRPTNPRALLLTPPALVLLSRVVAIGAGAAGSALWARESGWQRYDRRGVTESFGHVGNILGGSLVRWDSIHYLQISYAGYKAPWLAFFPLYPLLIKLIGHVIGSHVLAGLLISAVSFAVALVLLHRITAAELGSRAADAVVVLLAFAPLSFFFTALYTESLFLALSLGCFYAARRERRLAACLCAAAAAVTRVPGILLLVPLTMMWWRSEQRSWKTAAYLVLPPAALGGFLLYLHEKGFGFLGPFRSQQTVHLHSFSGPIVMIERATAGAWRGIREIWIGKPLIISGRLGPIAGGLHDLIEFVVLLICLVALIQAWRTLPKPYAVYASLVLLLCLWSPAKYEPLEGFDRYTLMMFPLWIVAADWLARRRLLYPVVVIGGCCMCFYAVEFARWGFIA